MISINVDQGKCTSPLDCRKCLESCPQLVLIAYPRIRRGAGKKAEGWIILPVFTFFCTGCKICEQVCPQGAIRISS